jgi:hypothetical protein
VVKPAFATPLLANSAIIKNPPVLFVFLQVSLRLNTNIPGGLKTLKKGALLLLFYCKISVSLV